MIVLILVARRFIGALYLHRTSHTVAILEHSYNSALRLLNVPLQLHPRQHAIHLTRRTNRPNLSQLYNYQVLHQGHRITRRLQYYNFTDAAHSDKCTVTDSHTRLHTRLHTRTPKVHHHRTITIAVAQCHSAYNQTIRRCILCSHTRDPLPTGTATQQRLILDKN